MDDCYQQRRHPSQPPVLEVTQAEMRATSNVFGTTVESG
jgi:hypothetical protein